MGMDAADATEIDVEGLDGWLKAGTPVALLDVREPWEVAICMLPGSRHVPMGLVPGHLQALPRDRPLVVLCHHGIRSGHVAAWLRRQGLTNAINLAGGIDAWACRIEPEMGRY